MNKLTNEFKFYIKVKQILTDGTPMNWNRLSEKYIEIQQALREYEKLEGISNE